MLSWFRILQDGSDSRQVIVSGLPDLMAPANSDFEFLSHSLVNPTDKCSASMCACCDPENDTVNLRMPTHPLHCGCVHGEIDDSKHMELGPNEICTATC